MNSRKGILTLSLAASLIIISSQSQAEIALDNSQTELKFAVINIGEPYEFTNSSGHIAGILVEITQLLLAKSNIKANIEITPYKRMIHELKAGSIDCAMFFTSQIHSKDFFQLGLIAKKPVIIINSPAQASAKNLSDFEGRNIGRIRGAHYGSEFDDNQKIRKSDLNNYQQGVAQVMKSRIDGFIGAQESIAELYDLSIGYYTLSSRENWLQCSKTSPRMQTPEILEKLYSGLQLLHNRDERLDPISIIHRKYLQSYTRPL
ncbi:ABC transporter substrate-binding protein [Shewanella sp. UCD-KL12]|uniref:substrate-binding periplasmic protein n=1 Tax=Shewanella sp. UCD-KL12 TaxID=1917163 RepID=UPI0009703269|nr:transporter substrate-binding domain-containing protein [Shewanella sp. UCD-KL12]